MLSRDPLADPEQLVRRVYAYARYRVGDGPDAEDVTSETFERALRHKHTYDPRRGEPITWLIGIARHCADKLLSERRREGGPVADIASSQNVEEETLLQIQLDAAFATLSERDQELVTLRYGVDLTPAQIGELLGMKRNAVDVALHRAVARLRAAMEAAGESEGGEAVRNDPPERYSDLKPRTGRSR